VTSLKDLVRAMPLIRDPGQRAVLYPKVEPLLDGLPKELAAAARDAQSVLGRYVRIELPGRRRTLTLAEVEVYSNGRNIARHGKASQKSTADHFGDARRAIDGNTSGKYGDWSQAHSGEGVSNPWWEVDLGADYPIDSVVIYNRTDAGMGKRLDRFTLTPYRSGSAPRRVPWTSCSWPTPSRPNCPWTRPSGCAGSWGSWASA
jgi:hypothetical protein